MKHTPLMLEVFKQPHPTRTPIWLMRQAGRYMSEYQQVRQKAGGFLSLCYNSDLAAEVTLQPIKKFDLDAAIIFSDILVIPHAMGMKVEFINQEGPKLERIKNLDDILHLNLEIEEKLNSVYEAIKISRRELSQDKALIGFVGAPWTIATYMLEGGGSKDFSLTKKMAYLHPEIFTLLIDKLITTISLHLIKQIQAGAQIVQIFDSWASLLDQHNFQQWVINPTKKIVSNIKKIYPDVPIIGFAKGVGIFYSDYIDHTLVDGVSIDANLADAYIKNNLVKKKVVLQGNLDPIYLLADKETLKKQVEKVLKTFSGTNHIFNLGHGVMKETQVENVDYLVKLIRDKQ
jgi:uroporphyrinogen decarboxylase